MGLPEDELQSLTAQPGNDHVCPIESGRDEQGVMSTLLIAHHDLRLGDPHVGSRIHEISKQMPGLGVLVALANATCQQAVQATGHQRQLQVAVDFHRHGRAQCVHVKEVDPIRDAVLDDHPLGVPPEQFGRWLCQLVGQQDCRLLMAQISSDHLTQRTVVTNQSDAPVEDPRMLVFPRDTLQLDPAPRRAGRLADLSHEPWRATAQGDEFNSQPIELIELGVGRQLGIEDQFFGISPRPFLPKLDEAEDLIVLLALAQFTVGVTEDAGLGVLDQEGQDALLPPTPLGYVVLLDQGIIAMKGDCVKVQVEGMTAWQAELADGIEPVAHQLRVAAWVDPATVFRQERSLGDDVQAGEQGQPLVQHHAHDMSMARRPEQLQGQERSHGRARRNHLRAGEPRFFEDAIEGNRSQQRQKQEQSAEFGPEGPQAQVELPNVSDSGRGRPRAGWALIVGPARQPRKSFFLEDLSDCDWAERTSLVGQVATDVVYGQVLFAQGDDTVAEGVGLGGGPGPFGRYQKEVASRVLAELVDENSEAPRCVAEAASDLGTGDAFNEEGAEGLILAVGRVGGLEERLRKVR